MAEVRVDLCASFSDQEPDDLNRTMAQNIIRQAVKSKTRTQINQERRNAGLYDFGYGFRLVLRIWCESKMDH